MYTQSMQKLTLKLTILALLLLGIYTIFLYITSFFSFSNKVLFQECQPSNINYEPDRPLFDSLDGGEPHGPEYCFSVVQTYYANHSTYEGIIHRKTATIDYIGLYGYAFDHDTGVDKIEWTEDGLTIYDTRSRTITIPTKAFIGGR